MPTHLTVPESGLAIRYMNTGYPSPKRARTRAQPWCAATTVSETGISMVARLISDPWNALCGSTKREAARFVATLTRD